MDWNLERVELWLEELRIDLQSFLLGLFDVLEHTKGKLPFDFLSAAWIESRVEGHDRVVLHQGQFDD